MGNRRWVRRCLLRFAGSSFAPSSALLASGRLRARSLEQLFVIMIKRLYTTVGIVVFFSLRRVAWATLSFQGIERMTRGALYSEVRNGDDDV